MQSQLASTPSFNGIYPIYKERGETLAVLLERFRIEHTLDTETKLTYAGRLDPMAEGLVLVLAGEARFEKDALLGLPKTYIVEILLAVSTDTLDPLGFITAIDCKVIDHSSIEKAVVGIKSITSLPYPIYSSVPVDGKPLFMHAREGNTVEIPEKKVVIHDVELVSIKQELLSTLASNAIGDIEKVVGDFRQDKIIEKWKALVDDKREVQIVTIKVAASSGTYMRSLAEWLGQKLEVPALAYSIYRTNLGEYEIKKPS